MLLGEELPSVSLSGQACEVIPGNKMPHLQMSIPVNPPADVAGGSNHEDPACSV